MTEKPKIREVIVVEGRDDTRRLLELYDVMTIETRGSALSDEVLEEIEMAADRFGIIIFTDPDVSGTKLRRKIADVVPEAKHAFLTPEEARPAHQGSLGVEHASDAAIQRALTDVYDVISPDDRLVPAPTTQQLYHLGLLGLPDAQCRRDYLCEALHIGHTNGKQLAKRLYLFQIEWAKVEAIMAHYDEEVDAS